MGVDWERMLTRDGSASQACFNSLGEGRADGVLEFSGCCGPSFPLQITGPVLGPLKLKECMYEQHTMMRQTPALDVRVSIAVVDPQDTPRVPG